jgi:hypothetical protein
MKADTQFQMRALCRQVTTERDAEKLLALLREMNRLVAEQIGHDKARAS